MEITVRGIIYTRKKFLIYVFTYFTFLKDSQVTNIFLCSLESLPTQKLFSVACFVLVIIFYLTFSKIYCGV